MGKGIIVIDMPENCQCCPFLIKDMRLKTGLCAVWESLHDDMHIIPPEYEKPDWCPLRPLPEKRDTPALNTVYDWHDNGWNACIKAITGN